MLSFKRVPLFVLVAAGILSIVGSSIALPFSQGHTDSPPFLLLLLSGLLVAAVVVVILAIASGLGMSLRPAVMALVIGFNLIIVALKFIVAPAALYSTNAANGGFPDTDFLTGGRGSYWLVALSTLVVYLIVLAIVYRLAKRRLRPASAKPKHSLVSIILAVILTLVVLYLSPVVLLVFPFINYVGDMNALLGVIALLVIAAITMAVVAFKRTADDEAKGLARGGLLAGLFWLCASLVVLDHVLWVIFMTALVTIWPFKTFIPNTK